MADLPRIRIDEDAHMAWLGDRPLTLGPLPFGILACLAANVGKVVTPREIRNEVWGINLGTIAKTLSMHISNLRTKLGDDSEHPRYITTVRGIGFRLEAGTVDQPEALADVEEAATRVLLIKPGDALVFGNVGTVPDPERMRVAVADLRDQLRLAAVLLFDGDIDMAAVSAGSAGG